jgi:hypothetical protein
MDKLLVVSVIVFLVVSNWSSLVEAFLQDYLPCLDPISVYYKQNFPAMAFRCGVRCGRHFGSEPGLRQHVSALHAPPGTWLCRTCGVDCITSQARTHHERSCGQPIGRFIIHFQEDCILLD